MADADAPKSDLATRAAIGASLAVFAILALWLDGATLWALLTAGAVVALIEWAGLVRAHRARLGIGIIVLLVGMSYALPMLWGTERSTLALLLIAALLMALFPKASGVAIGVGYIGTAAIAILFLREQPNGFLLALWALAIVWATDIGAYFAGRQIGGARLAPAISPNKTWAGLAGGAVSAAIIGAAIAHFGQLPGTASWAGAPLAIVAQIGDLVESWMKRRVNRKDSGKILPGHGGLLDRIDGLLPVVIVVAALVANGSF
ncbi:MAG TPA: phosphatidate cytidylyltransferase [Sphingomonas sp.]|nr:phosphatidate cytidylyltransferase [Sphingomonas sp.]